MSLQETEVFGLMSHSLRSAADICTRIAWDKRRGFLYMGGTDKHADKKFTGLVEHLKKAEGCCRQAFVFHEDYRWSLLALQIETAHKMAGRWMRSSPTQETRDAAHRLFLKLAEQLRAIAVRADQLKTRAKHNVGLGPLLPAPRPGPLRDTRPVQVKSPGGIIIPAGVIAPESPTRH